MYKLFITSLGLLSALSHNALYPASAENSARYLVLENCGGYIIDEIVVQKRPRFVADWDNPDPDGSPGIKKNKGSWDRVNSWSDESFSLHEYEAGCFDISKADPGANDLYEYRLKADINAGQTKKCDSTNYDESNSPDMRIMRMGGTSYNNNHCKSRKYVDPTTHGRGSDYLEHCSKHGGRTREISC